jgi:hypothetical protein
LKAEYARLLLLHSTLLSVHTLPKITQTKLSYRPTLIFTEITVSAREGAGPLKKRKNAKTQEPEREKEKHRREREKRQPKDYLPACLCLGQHKQGEKEQQGD